MSVLLEPLRALLNMITSLINGLIVGSLHFILNLLDGLDDVDLLLDHTVDSVKNFFTAFLNLGTSLFPFIPAEWLTIIEAAAGHSGHRRHYQKEGVLMQGLGQVLSACLQIFQIEFTVDGLTFTLWNILLWLIVAGAVIYLLFKWGDDN